MIQTLVERSAERTGLTVEQARTALSAALFLIDKHAEPACVKDLFASVPGAQALAEQGAALGQNKAGGLVAGMMRNVGGASGAAMSDAMSVGQRLTRQGITTADMQSILPVAMQFVRETTSRDLLRDVLNTIPGLGPLLTAED
jgi:hypothetical protein